MAEKKLTIDQMRRMMWSSATLFLRVNKRDAFRYQDEIHAQAIAISEGWDDAR